MNYNFERRLMKKYPSLFRTDEDGNTVPSDCGIGVPEQWEEIIDSLCGSIVEYITTETKSVKTKNPFVLFKYFLHRRIWCPIHYILMDIANPYHSYRPKEGWKGFIPPDIQKKINQSKRTKIQSFLQRFTFVTIYPNDAWITVPACCDPVKIDQVKSKFGSLRFYIDGGDDAVHGMIRFAEYLCEQANKKNNKTSKQNQQKAFNDNSLPVNKLESQMSKYRSPGTPPNKTPSPPPRPR